MKNAERAAARVTRPVALAVVLVVLAVALPAVADGPPTVALVRTAGDRKIASRLRAELDASGWHITEVRFPSEVRLPEVAHHVRAIAALRVRGHELEIELWIANPETGATAFDRVVAAEPGRVDDLPLQAVEILRARLIKLGIAAEATAGEPEAPGPQQPEATEASPAPWLWVELGPALGLSPGGLGLVPQVKAGLVLEPSPGWSAAVFTLLPTFPSAVEAAEGEADVWVGMLAVAGDATLARAPAWGYALGAGAAVVQVQMKGSAEAPYVGEQDSVLAAAGFTRISAYYRLAAAWRLRGEFLSGLAAPRPTVRFAERQVASWGRPFALVIVELELGILGF